MKTPRPAICLLFILGAFACKSSKKARSSGDESIAAPVSNISLYDKPLDTLKRHVTGQKWQMIYSTGGITGNDMNVFENTYYTLTKAGIMIIDKDGNTEETPYSWEQARDILTGNMTYVITGVVQWRVEGINNDTLRVADNYVDGYSYALVRVK